MTYELVEYHQSGSGDYILRIKHSLGLWKWLARIVGDEPWHRTYIGSCTVWRDYSSWSRLPSHKEAVLCDIWKKIQHEKECQS